jgi:hypothetical protein
MKQQEFIYRYKYLPFNENSLKILTEGTIKFTDPETFNDPFDCRPPYVANVEDIAKTKFKTIRKYSKKRGESPAQTILKKRKYAAKMKINAESGVINNNVAINFGMVCLTSTPDNLLMWSHYADSHKGFIVGFKIPTNGAFSAVNIHNEKAIVKYWTDCLYPLPVAYCTERPVVFYGSDSDLETSQKRLLSKSVDWEYERESRVIDTTRPPCIYHYNRNLILHSVIAGLNMEDEDYHRLGSIMRDLREKEGLTLLTLYKAEADKREYKVLIPNFKTPIDD